MLDLSHIPSQKQQTFTFYATGNWQTWSKPRNAKMIQIFCLGGGGSGGHAAAGAGNSSAGGGGGSGGIVRGLIPAFLLPDTLYILVGKGGIGPITSNTTGNSGGHSFIGLQPSISEQTLICKSGTGTFSGGGGGATGTAGAAAAISNVALSAFGNLGLFTAVAGAAGGVGINSAGSNNPTVITALGTNIVTGGQGGGGKSLSSGFAFAGQQIDAGPVILTNRVKGGETEGAGGDNGYGRFQPLCGTGGGGGAGQLTGPCGRGGNGWYGCGGGGTGGGSTVSKAGDGGDGLVIITVIT